MNKFKLFLLLPLVIATCNAALAQTPEERRQQMGNTIMKHPGMLGALAPENLNKERPPAPFNLTGTWFVDLSGGFGNFRFGPPYPEFIGQAKLDFEEGER